VPVERFLHAHEVFTRYGDAAEVAVRDVSIKYYVFIDDLCGSGDQAWEYSRDLVGPLKAKHADCEASYFALFATTEGISRVRSETAFDRVDCVFELDATFRSFSDMSRHFTPCPPEVDRQIAERIFAHYGSRLWPAHPLGYKNGQLLLGFWHNTPDNTLTAIWHGESGAWTPIFERFQKIL